MLISPSRRAKDAHGAKLYLAGLHFVDRNRIAVLGWSHGGMAVLEAVTMSHPFGSPFNAAIAYYPYCTQLSITNAPLLVLIGEKDDWTPADRCKALIFSEGSEPEIILKVYPDAHHAFDQPFRLNYYMGHMVGRDSSAASDSYNKVRAFLEKYLKDH
jgi:dienelactone hydrolase